MKYGTLDMLGAKLHPTEPWFTLRAQDALAPYAVQSYATLLRAAGMGARQTDPDHVTQAIMSGVANDVHLAAAEMLHWQIEHPDLVKLPD